MRPPLPQVQGAVILNCKKSFWALLLCACVVCQLSVGALAVSDNVGISATKAPLDSAAPATDDSIYVPPLPKPEVLDNTPPAGKGGDYAALDLGSLSDAPLQPAVDLERP